MTSFLVLSLHSSPWSRPGIGDAGGMNVYVRHTCAELVAAGHEVVCATLPRAGEVPLPDPPPWLVELDVPLGAVPKSRLPDHMDAITAAVRPLADVDVVLAHYWISAEVGRRVVGRARLVTMFHTTAAGKNERLGPGETPEPARRVAAETRAAAASAAIIVNSAGERRDTARLLHVDPERCRVIAPGIDHTVFHPGPRPARAELVVGLAARLQPLKGPQVLLRALRLLDGPMRAWIIGNGAPEFLAELHELAPPGTEFLGSLEPAELADRMRSADLWAVPSSSETFGLVAAEAQACGTPVLATDIGGLPHAVGGGWLVPDREPATWARMLRRAADPVERAAAARRGIAHTRSLTWANTAAAIAAI